MNEEARVSNEIVALGKLPLEFTELLIATISRYAVGIVGVYPTTDHDDVRLIGSGTFVDICGVKCILTASHVLKSELYHTSEKIGVVASTEVKSESCAKEEIVIGHLLDRRPNQGCYQSGNFLGHFTERLYWFPFQERPTRTGEFHHVAYW